MCKGYATTVCLFVLLLLGQTAIAQWQGNFSASASDANTDVDTTGQQAGTSSSDVRLRNVYSPDDQRLVTQISASSKPNIISRQGDRLLVTFSEPTVPGWVSAEFVAIRPDSNVATVKANVLNVRISPGVSAPRLTQVYNGYTSRILDEKAGFVRILTPANLEVLLDDFDVNSDIGVTLADASLVAKVNGESSDAGNSVPQMQNASRGVESNSPELTLSSNSIDANNVAENTHLLAPGDSISLLVFGEPDLSAQNVRVPQSGRVSFPLIGPVVVLGKTTADVEKEVAALLSQGYVRNPRLSVSIFSYRPIFIRGEVSSSGAFPYSEGLTVSKAIALAGGLTDSAKANGISITRDGTVVAEGLSVDSQRTVASGDIVSISADLEVKQAESSYVYLHGEVVQAGAYEYKKGLTVEKAVVLAGGFTLRASKKKIRISRYEDIEENGAPVELKRVKLYAPVKPGDVIKVGASWF